MLIKISLISEKYILPIHCLSFANSKNKVSHMQVYVIHWETQLSLLAVTFISIYFFNFSH